MKRDGFVLVVVLSIAVLIGVILVVSSTFSIIARQTVTAETQKIPAFYAANAGLERAMARISTLITPTQTVTKAGLASTGKLYRDSTTDDVAADLAVRLNATPNLGASTGSRGSVAGGAFEVTAAPKGNSTVELKSAGWSTTGGERKIVLSYVITPSSIKAATAGALATTGPSGVSGGGNVVGQTGTVGTGSIVTCPGAVGNTCPSPSSPPVYQVIWPTATLPNLNDNVTYASNPPTDALYKVTKIDAATGAVELTAVNEYINVTTTNKAGKTTVTQQMVPLSSPAHLAVTTEVPAILSYLSSPSAKGGAASSCDVYTCGYLSTDPSKLFEATFGVTKVAFEGDLTDSTLTNAIITSDTCPSGSTDSKVQWLRPTSLNGGQLNLTPCDTPRVLVVDLPTIGCSANNQSCITISLNNGGFKGLLYIIGNGQSVQIAGNAGSFAGGVIVETGTNADASNPVFTVSGTAKTGYCGAVDAKICYNASLSATVIPGLKASLDTTALPGVDDLQNSWQEAEGN
ncbi:hypothetical protein DEDE109153_13155 [Deinococcus deserti]|uniref:Type 4 fimbrial biogenesis protein PilX N-terminal domain-containing protein n=1 Tax=Deinococcus deserti (strain DSM 17065 / CIP 109153 / LMG 22923 / VCD115) TaxID=546414 RepID=X5H5L5_DEIDV|nr:hypothetical protein [Deinococcus deserti]AHX26483.1 hypothetical protein Deide_02768 [Deinococcus deserti VCD115]